VTSFPKAAMTGTTGRGAGRARHLAFNSSVPVPVCPKPTTHGLNSVSRPSNTMVTALDTKQPARGNATTP
jgi:hypothetical protein